MLISAASSKAVASTVPSSRPLAKDEANLPPERSTERRAALQIGNRETYDYEFIPKRAARCSS